MKRPKSARAVSQKLPSSWPWEVNAGVGFGDALPDRSAVSPRAAEDAVVSASVLAAEDAETCDAMDFMDLRDFKDVMVDMSDFGDVGDCTDAGDFMLADFRICASSTASSASWDVAFFLPSLLPSLLTGVAAVDRWNT